MANEVMYLVMGESNTGDGNGPLTPVCLVETEFLAREIITSETFARKYAVMGYKIPFSQSDTYFQKITNIKTFEDFCVTYG